MREARIKCIHATKVWGAAQRADRQSKAPSLPRRSNSETRSARVTREGGPPCHVRPLLQKAWWAVGVMKTEKEGRRHYGRLVVLGENGTVVLTA